MTPSFGSRFSKLGGKGGGRTALLCTKVEIKAENDGGATQKSLRSIERGEQNGWKTEPTQGKTRAKTSLRVVVGNGRHNLQQKFDHLAKPH